MMTYVVELALRQWQEDGYREVGASSEDMWRKYDALTHDLSCTLCEQLCIMAHPRADDDSTLLP